MNNPFSPGHPQFLTTDPHVFLNPYTFIVALSGLAVSLDQITSLALFSIINYCLFFGGLYLFISTIDNKNKKDICFYTVLLILFLHGDNPWQFSGFFNSDIFLSVLPLPSTFVMGLSFIGFYLNFLRLKQSRNILLLPLLSITTFSILSHPLTTIFLFTGLLAQALADKRISSLISFTFLFFLTFIFASFWPFFSIVNLMFSGGNTYHALNINLYSNIVNNIWPSLIFIPIILNIIFEKQNRVLLFSLIILIGIYLYGYFFQRYAYGRSISFILIIVNIFIAILIFKQELKLKNFNRNIYLLTQLIFIILLVIFNASWLKESTQRALTIANSIRIGRPIFNEITFSEYTFLKRYTGHDDLIIADLNSSWIIPAFSGKVIATMLPAPLVKDVVSRTNDMVSFFDLNASDEMRCKIIKLYKPKFLFLINPPAPGFENLYNQFGPIGGGQLIFNNNKFTLIEINDNTCN
ncbi:MAG: hypothetical protein NBV66_00800 [Burkholderiaceae bacterium]|nr:hypothetical protein [Burkholderiaceae bacterium]